MNPELLKAIEDVRKVYRLTDEAFAKSIGMDPGGWSRKKRGLTKLNKDDLDRMVNAYGELKMVIWRSIGSGPAPTTAQ